MPRFAEACAQILGLPSPLRRAYAGSYLPSASDKISAKLTRPSGNSVNSFSALPGGGHLWHHNRLAELFALFLKYGGGFPVREGTSMFDGKVPPHLLNSVRQAACSLGAPRRKGCLDIVCMDAPNDHYSTGHDGYIDGRVARLYDTKTAHVRSSTGGYSTRHDKGDLSGLPTVQSNVVSTVPAK